MSPRRVRTGVLLALILAAAIGLRIYLFQGIFGSDDLAYAKIAYKTSLGGYRIIEDQSLAMAWKLRRAFVTPVSWSIRLFGVHEWAMLLYPFLISIATVFLAYFAGKIFFNTRTGLIASLLVAISPYEIMQATSLMTDMAASFYASLGIYFLYRVSQENQKRWAWALCSGLAFGVSWMTRENVFYLSPFILLMAGWLAVTRPKTRMSLLILSAAAFSILLLEFYMNIKDSGDFLLRFHGIEHNYEPAANLVYPNGFQYYPHYQGFELIKRLFKTGPSLIFNNDEFVFYPAFALLAVLYAWVRKCRQFVWPAIWFVLSVLIYNFASASLKNYVPLPLCTRLYYPILFPSTILLAGFLEYLLNRGSADVRELIRERFFWGIAIVLSIFLCVSYTLVGKIRVGIASPVERKIVSLAKPSDVIYTDWRTIEVLNFFWGFAPQPNLKSFNELKFIDIPSGSFVLINKPKLDFQANIYGIRALQLAEPIPSRWQTVWKSDKGFFYKVP